LLFREKPVTMGVTGFLKLSMQLHTECLAASATSGFFLLFFIIGTYSTAFGARSTTGRLFSTNCTFSRRSAAARWSGFFHASAPGTGRSGSSAS